MKSVEERSKFLSSLQSALEHANLTATTPSLTHEFCMCLGKVKVNPKFIYRKMGEIRKEQSLLVLSLSNSGLSKDQFLCEVWVEEIYLGLGTGRSKTAAKTNAVQQVVEMLRLIKDKTSVDTRGLEYFTSRLTESMQSLNLERVNEDKIASGEPIKKSRIIDINNNSDDDMGGEVSSKSCVKGGHGLEKVEGKVKQGKSLKKRSKGVESKRQMKKKEVVVNNVNPILLHYGPKLSNVGIVDERALIIKSVDGVSAVATLKTSAEVSEVAIDLYVENVSISTLHCSQYICTVFVDGEAVADAVSKTIDACKNEAAKLALQHLSSIHTSVKVTSNRLNKEACGMTKLQFKAKASFLFNKEMIPTSNIGYKMLVLLGWNAGEGLGKDGIGRLEPVAENGMKFFGQKPALKIGNISCREAEAVIKDYVVEESVEDLLINTSNIATEEVAAIKMVARKFNLSVKSVAPCKGVSRAYLVLSKFVGLSDIAQILKEGTKSVVYQGTSKYELVDSEPCKLVVLCNQHFRGTRGDPVPLVKPEPGIKSKKQKYLRKYQHLGYNYDGMGTVPPRKRRDINGLGYEADNTWDVQVTYVEYFDRIYVILVDRKLSKIYQDMVNRLNTWAQSSCFMDTGTKLVVGKLYAARIEQKWSRAKLMKDLGESLVTCQLIDQGDYHMVHRNSLLDLPLQFNALPALSIPVSLHGMSRVTWKDWNEDTANTMEDILQHHQLVATVTNRQSLDTVTTNLTKPRLVLSVKAQGVRINVNQALQYLFGKKKAEAPSRHYNRPSIINPQHLPLLVYHTPLILPALPTVDDLLHLFIVPDINHLDQFVVQLVQSVPDLLHLEQHMQRFYIMRVKDMEKGERMARGDFVAAKNLGRSLTWCRAIVLRKTLTGRYLVRFTDWGNTDIVPLSDIQPLPRQFRNLPSLAMYSVMAGGRVPIRGLISDKQFLGQVVHVGVSEDQYMVNLELNLYEGREEFLGGKKFEHQLVEEENVIEENAICDETVGYLLHEA